MQDEVVQIFRVTVRGWFDQMDDEQRARLLDQADAHDLVATGAFTETGTLTYERSLRTFAFRAQLRAEDPDAEEEVVARATAMTGAALAELGVTGRDLKVDAQDMASIWERSGGRRA